MRLRTQRGVVLPRIAFTAMVCALCLDGAVLWLLWRIVEGETREPTEAELQEVLERLGLNEPRPVRPDNSRCRVYLSKTEGHHRCKVDDVDVPIDDTLDDDEFEQQLKAILADKFGRYGNPDGPHFEVIIDAEDAVSSRHVVTVINACKELGIRDVSIAVGEIPMAEDKSTEAQMISHFVFARIQDTVAPLERGEKYEDPLSEALQQTNIGEVTGGGTMQNKDGSIAWIGVDIELNDLTTGIPLVRQKLRELGAPTGSVLEYTVDDEPIEVPVHD